MAMNNGGNSFWPRFEENKMFTVLLGILTVYGIVWLGANIRKTLIETRFVGMAERQPATIMVSATGHGKAVPDLAMVSFSVSAMKPTAAEAQAEATAKTNAILPALKEIGIAEEDIQTTGVSTSEERDYVNDPTKIVGYRTYSSISVKVRDNAKVGAVLAKVAELGATNISGPQFILEDNEVALAQARTEALEKAKRQADQIAAAMGARLGGVVTYGEDAGGYGPYPMYARAEAGMDAGGMKVDIAPGQEEVTVNVVLQYAIY